MTAAERRQCRMECHVRVSPERTLTDGATGHFLQNVQMLMHGFLCQTLIRSQKQVVSVVEIEVEGAERDIFGLVFLSQKRKQVFI